MRREILTHPQQTTPSELAPGVEVALLATGALGAVGLTTALATFRSQSRLPFHVHPCSEVIILLEGEATLDVMDRRYLLQQYDCVHVPAGIPHSVSNLSRDKPAVLHCSFPCAAPAREEVRFDRSPRECNRSDSTDPERLFRFKTVQEYELAPQAMFRDLFAARLGVRGICGGFGLFQSGASLPLHFHDYDESITIVQGEAVCQAENRFYTLKNCDTACIPTIMPHRFLNHSQHPMAMIWVYAGDEPKRTLVETHVTDLQTKCAGDRSDTT